MSRRIVDVRLRLRGFVQCGLTGQFLKRVLTLGRASRNALLARPGCRFLPCLCQGSGDVQVLRWSTQIIVNHGPNIDTLRCRFVTLEFGVNKRRKLDSQCPVSSLRAHTFFSSYLACIPTPGHDRMWHNEIALDWQTKDPAQFWFFVFHRDVLWTSRNFQPLTLFLFDEKMSTRR